ncbi:MAG: 50S ribosomal protein L21 [Blastochloris sp.]|nr:50S ribosomal protein L21 [Blastochloris sp.]
MFAVIRSGSKQYKVIEGEVLDVELFPTEEGKDAVLDEVLMIGNGDKVQIGQPVISGAKVTAEILGEVKGDKVIAYKYKRRKGYHRTVGHRQKRLRLKINKISA